MVTEQVPLYRKPAGYQQITVSSTAIGLTIPKGAQKAVFAVEAQPLRYRNDGVDPTASVGMLCAAGVQFEMHTKEALEKFKAIRSGGTDSVLSVTYYK